ncbi:MAG: hypothetical protein K2X32_03880, partial [Phycisphaerales bacterium]|nr:hypothetical protein [Phycisphaerales bacterium]
MAKLNDESIERLLRTAHEVDRLEDELVRGTSGGRGVVLRRIGWGVGVAIAAGLAIATTISLVQPATPTPTSPRAGDRVITSRTPAADRGRPEVAQLPVAPELPVSQPTDGRSGVLLAIVGHADGSLRCVNWSADPFQGRALSELRDD